jgi:hypothetical protein
VEKRIKLAPTNSTTKPKDKPKERFMAVPSAFEPRSVNLAVAQPTASVASSGVPYLLQWLRSGKNLDFCLLAICSCILTILCHHTSVLPSSSTPTSASTAPIANFSSLDFTIKAGLFTRSTESDELEVESAED